MVGTGARLAVVGTRKTGVQESDGMDPVDPKEGSVHLDHMADKGSLCFAR